LKITESQKEHYRVFLIVGGEEENEERWLDDVEDDLGKLVVKRWRIKAMDRTGWRKICEVAKVLL
jgi:hypothetical protein